MMPILFPVRFFRAAVRALCLGLLPFMALLCSALAFWPAEPVGAVPAKTWLAGGKPDYWELPGVVNLSGIAWQADGDRLWAVLNNPTVLLQLDADGQIVRKVWLKGFEDTEGIAWLYGNTFALVEERRCTVAVIDLADDVKQFDYADAQVRFVPDGCQKNNQGLEGVAYDAASDSLYIAQESAPRRIWLMDGMSSDNGPRVARVLASDDQLDAVGADIAGLHVMPGSGQVLVLSEESQRISTLTQQAAILRRENLSSVGSLLPQPEGLTQDGQGRLYIVSEPNIVVRYQAGG